MPRGVLQFPKTFANGNLPFVIFTPYVYRCPSPVIQELTNQSKDTSTTSNIVALYLPSDYSEGISSDWGMQDVYQGTAPTAWGSMLGNLGERLQNVDGGKVISSSESIAGMMPFPTDVAVFKGTAPMSLNFNFNMIPYDKAEGDIIISIIKNFKKAIMPMQNGGAKNVLLKFPNTWDISFENINGLGLETDNLYEDMALTSCNVSFVSGNENASVYHDNNPTQVKLSLAFQSMRKQFLQG